MQVLAISLIDDDPYHMTYYSDVAGMAGPSSSSPSSSPSSPKGERPDPWEDDDEYDEYDDLIVCDDDDYYKKKDKENDSSSSSSSSSFKRRKTLQYLQTYVFTSVMNKARFGILVQQQQQQHGGGFLPTMAAVEEEIKALFETETERILSLDVTKKAKLMVPSMIRPPPKWLWRCHQEFFLQEEDIRVHVASVRNMKEECGGSGSGHEEIEKINANYKVRGQKMDVPRHLHIVG